MDMDIDTSMKSNSVNVPVEDSNNSRGEIGMAVNTLSLELNLQEELIHKLVDRLQPILMEARPQPGGEDSQNHSYESSVAISLQQQVDEAESHNMILRELLSRVAL